MRAHPTMIRRVAARLRRLNCVTGGRVSTPHTTRACSAALPQVMGRLVTPYIPPPELADVPVEQLRRVVHRSNPDLRCRQLHPDHFFKSKTAEFARALCTGCPIRDECAELALREEIHGYFQGVRGGLSPTERRALVRQRKTAREDSRVA